MKLLLVEDEFPARKQLLQILQEQLPDAIFEEASSGTEAIDLMSLSAFDAIFLDIDLGDMLGTTVASVASKLQQNVPIVFATAYSDYAVKAFEIGAMDYILKPFDAERIAQTIERLQSASVPNTAYKTDKIAITHEKRILLLPPKEIIYIETNGRGSILHTKTAIYETTTPIGSLEQRLVGQPFFRIHKSFLVNLDFVNSVFLWKSGSYAMNLKGFEKEILPIGRSQFKALKLMFGL